MRLTSVQLHTVLALAILSIAATRPGNPDQPVAAAVSAPAPAVVAAPEMAAGGLQEPAPYHPEPVSIGDSAGYTPPTFATYTDVKAKKRAFYGYLLPMVHEANEEVMRERAWLQMLASDIVAGQQVTPSDLAELVKIERRYAIRRPAGSTASRVGELLRRVDVVPASLVIAQAAKESGWGTSRFAREGNNFFGIWCFYEGCGMLPLSRESGRNHEVAKFETVEEGVRYYIRTINTHSAYNDLRIMRAQARRNNQPAAGTVLAGGLIRYSERGLAYVKEIQSMIRYNQLQRFTRPYPV